MNFETCFCRTNAPRCIQLYNIFTDDNKANEKDDFLNLDDLPHPYKLPNSAKHLNS